MAVRTIHRGSNVVGGGTLNAAPIYVDADDNILKMIPAGSGTTEVQLIDATSTQTISGTKTFTGTVNLSGSISGEFADGTAAAPSITFTSDTDSGFYRIGADNVGFALNGAVELNFSTSAFSPGASDGSALGTTALMWSDLFLASGAVINFNNGDVTLTHAANTVTLAGGTLAPGEGLDFTGLTPAASPISFTGVTLAASTNAIRGISVTPTRASGWTCFTGNAASSLTAVYSDYREMHATGTDVVLGIGSFPYMDSGASGNSLFAGQFISYLSSGSTLTTAAAAPMVGAYALVGKTVVDSATVDSGAQVGAIALSVQANVTDISGRASCIAYMEVASGLLRDIFTLNATASVLATNLFYFSAAVSPLTTGGSGTPTAASGTWYNLRCSINGTAAYIPISTAAWTNA